MARNGSGAYSLPTVINPVVAGTDITADWANTTLTDIASEITNSLDKSGRTTPTADLPMGGFSLTGLAAGAAAGESVRYEQVWLNGYGTVASATTTDLGASDAGVQIITGTTTITGFGSTAPIGQLKIVLFQGILTLTHHSTDLVLPTGANITTAAGDMAGFVHTATGDWRCAFYSRYSGAPVLASIVANAGSASAPGFSFSGDSNTGIYASAADNVSITAGGGQIANFNTTDVLFTKRMTAGPYIEIEADAANYSGIGALYVTGATPFGSAIYVAVDSANELLTYAVSGNKTFEIDGSGNISTDGSTTISTPADYAEMFEWEDGNPNNEDRVGLSVVLKNGFIREAGLGEIPIGVVSGCPAVLAGAAELHWIGKYLRDDFNRPVLEANGEKVINPHFDPEREYIPRTKRKEWAPVGLMGKLSVRKGQYVSGLWIKIREVSPLVDEYLVR